MPADVRETESTNEPVVTATPSSAIVRSITAEASGSSFGNSRSEPSNIDTSLPKPANAMAISQPMAPPPMIPSRGGITTRSKSVSFVSTPATSSRPGIGGIAAREPVARTTESAESCMSPTLTRPLPTISPRPSTTSMPSERNTSADSWSAIFWIARCTSAIASGKVNPARLRAIRVLDGTHPVHVQSPPIGPSDTKTGLAPRVTACRAAPSPALPPPTIMTS